MDARRVVPLALLVVAAAVVFLWPTGHPRDAAAPAVVPETTIPIIPGVYGGSWEIVRGAPVGNRARMAITEVGDRIVVWGGAQAGFAEADLAPDQFFQDGYLYDPAEDEWEPMAPVGFDLCPLADPVAIDGGFWAPIVVWGRIDAAPDRTCIPAAAYDPASATWRPLTGEFFERLRPAHVVLLEEDLTDSAAFPSIPGPSRLVAPEIGLYYDLPTGQTGSLESGPSVLPASGASAAPATTWTGDWLLIVDQGRLYGWEAAADVWRWNLGGTPIEANGQDITATGIGVFLVNRRMQAAMLDDPTAMLWSAVESLPLRASGCLPEIADVAGFPIVHTCVGVAAYDPSSGGWVPFTPPIGLQGQLLGTSDSLYWFSSQVSRLRLPRSGVVPPRRLPVGLTNIVLPEGYHFADSIGLVHTMDADFRILSEVHGFVVSTPTGGTCGVFGSYQPFLDMPPPNGTVVVDRPILPPLEVLDYSQGYARFVLETAPTDVIEVRCGRYEEGIALVAALQWIKL
jgi:hypothetical protein